MKYELVHGMAKEEVGNERMADCFHFFNIC